MLTPIVFPYDLITMLANPLKEPDTFETHEVNTDASSGAKSMVDRHHYHGNHLDFQADSRMIDWAEEDVDLWCGNPPHGAFAAKGRRF